MSNKLFELSEELSELFEKEQAVSRTLIVRAKVVLR